MQLKCWALIKEVRLEAPAKTSSFTRWGLEPLCTNTSRKSAHSHLDLLDMQVEETAAGQRFDWIPVWNKINGASFIA